MIYPGALREARTLFPFQASAGDKEMAEEKASMASLHCPICGGRLELPSKNGIVFGQKTCSGCENAYLVVITAYGKLVITADLIP